MDVGTERPKRCGSCATAEAPLRCPCKSAYYCDAACQKRSWGEHKGVCTAHHIKKLDKERERIGKDDPMHAGPAVGIGELFMSQDRLREAEEWFLEAERLLLLMLPVAERSEPPMDKAFAAVSGARGKLYHAQGRWEEALAMHRRALEAFTRAGEDLMVASLQNSVGEDLRKLARNEEALLHYNKALEAYCRLKGEDSWEAANVLGNVASVMDQQGLCREALAIKQQVLDIQRRIGQDKELLAVSLLNTGMSHVSLGNFEEAKTLLEEGLALVRAQRPERNALEGNFLMQLGNMYRGKGQLEEAAAMLKKAKSIFKRTIGPESVEVGKVMEYTAEVLREQGRVEEAVRLFGDAVEVKRKAVGEHGMVVHSLFNFARLKVKAGDPEGAAECLREAVRMGPGSGVPEVMILQCARMLGDVERGEGGSWAS